MKKQWAYTCSIWSNTGRLGKKGRNRWFDCTRVFHFCLCHIAYGTYIIFWGKSKQCWTSKNATFGKLLKFHATLVCCHFFLETRFSRYVVHDVHVSPVFEPSSLWSMSPLSSPCRMETAPGFSPWKLVIPHCGTPCLVFNFPINNFSQHLFARAGRCRGWCPAAWFKIGRRSKLLAQTKQTPDEVAASSHGWEWRFYALVIMQINRICLVLNFPRNCRGWCHDAYSDMGRCYQLVATLTLRGNTHTQIIPNPSQSSKHFISHNNWKITCLRIAMSQMEAELKFPQVQNRKVELLHHLRTLPTVPAMCVDSC